MPRLEPGLKATSAGLAGRARRAFVGVALLGIVCGYFWLLFVWLYRPDASDGVGPAESALAWASLMATTFLPHAGIALAAALVLCVLVRVRRPVVAGAPLLALSLGPWLWSFLPAHPPESGRTMLVLSANLLASTSSDEALLAQIDEHRPEVVLIQEVREASAQRLRNALGGDYSIVAAPREDNFGQAVLSRLPFTREPEVVFLGGEEPLPQIVAFVEFEGREVCVWNIHLLSPLSIARAGEQAAMAWQMGARLDALRGSGTPAVVAGDFNGPWPSQPLDALRARGYRQAHREAGRGPGATWPRITMLKRLPGITLDHIAHSRELACTQAWTGEDTGSDHKPVFARLAWR